MHININTRNAFRILTLVIFVIYAAGNSYALPDSYEVRYYNGMRYGLFIPPVYDPGQSYPLVLYLHGCNDTTSHNLELYHDSIQSEHPCFVVTPKAVNMVDWCDAWGNSWMPEHTTDMLNTLEIIDLLAEEFFIDTNRLHVYGISMGSFGTFSLLAKNSDMFASAMALCGGGNPLTAEEVANTPLWIFHGDADPMVPVDRSRIMYHAIINAGGTQVRYTEYPGVNHDVWRPALQEPTIWNWFLSHNKIEEHGIPDNAEDFNYQIIDNSHIELSWSPPSDISNPDNQVWYYNIFRNDELIAEVDNIYNIYTDSIPPGILNPEYKISTVSYFFKESDLSEPLVIIGLSVPELSFEDTAIDIYIAPNPARDVVRIYYHLSYARSTVLKIFDMRGMLIDVMENDFQHEGSNTITWNTEDVAAGTYFIKLSDGKSICTKKITIMKE